MLLFSSYSPRTLSGTVPSCGIVAGAAALVLEKFPHYTPQQVKEYLIDESTPGVVKTSSRMYKVKPNRFLYTGEEGKLCVYGFQGWIYDFLKGD